MQNPTTWQEAEGLSDLVFDLMVRLEDGEEYTREEWKQLTPADRIALAEEEQRLMAKWRARAEYDREEKARTVDTTRAARNAARAIRDGSDAMEYAILTRQENEWAY